MHNSSVPDEPNMGAVDDATTGHVARDRRRSRSLRRSLLSGLMRGFAGGVIATAAMSAVMLATQKAGLLGEMPPKKIVNRFLGLTGLHRATPEPAKKALAALTHFAFGGACGALFGVANEAWRARHRGAAAARVHGAPVSAGLAFGTAIWALSYAGWVPAIGAMPMPHADRPGRQPAMVLAHLVYGTVVAKIIA